MKLLLTILILWSSISSCGFLHKTFDSHKEHKKENLKSSTDSSASKRSDSSAVKLSDSASLKKKEQSSSSDVEVVFSDTSSHNKVEITTDSTGKQTIKAEGSIKSVKTNKKQESKTSDSTRAQSRDSSHIASDENGKVKKKVDSQINDSNQETHKDKKAFRIPWYAYLIGIIVILALLVYLYYRYRFQIVAWFIRIRNPGTNVYYDPKIKGYQIIKKNSNSS